MRKVSIQESRVELDGFPVDLRQVLAWGADTYIVEGDRLTTVDQFKLEMLDEQEPVVFGFETNLPPEDLLKDLIRNFDNFAEGKPSEFRRFFYWDSEGGVIYIFSHDRSSLKVTHWYEDEFRRRLEAVCRRST